MLVINHPWELNKLLKIPSLLVISYNFVTIYGLPYSLLYSKRLQKLYKNIKIALDLAKEQATATLAILENYPYIIIDKKTHKELNIIKNNCQSTTKILSNIEEFNS